MRTSHRFARRLYHPLAWRLHYDRLFSSIQELQGSVSYLRNPINGAEVYLVGTSHVSRRSAQEVKEVIKEVQPNIVAVELCEERAHRLQSGQDKASYGFREKFQDFLKFPGGIGGKIFHVCVKSMYEILRQSGLEPGKEFKVAIDEANRVGAQLLFMDQDVKVTVARIASVITFWDVVKLLTHPPTAIQQQMLENESSSSDNIEDRLERLKSRETVTKMIRQIEELFPNIVRVIVHERDEVMAKQLLACEGKIVGVVGMGHMDGIERIWKESSVSRS